ncbi:Protein CBG05615 [Caenorhabditis briggsae]|uniref:Protein CBG05615 n=1 Tax=Caenorhabditis briggsae TaxID=6238 RepID=A8X098_CAEBR|nr:Protein CBG05615 [Caenorhabditis briggsae]CAP26058.1 Protein CBG05615 [Caenorhabditis briggsae]
MEPFMSLDNSNVMENRMQMIWCKFGSISLLATKFGMRVGPITTGTSPLKLLDMNINPGIFYTENGFGFAVYPYIWIPNYCNTQIEHRKPRCTKNLVQIYIPKEFISYANHPRVFNIGTIDLEKAEGKNFKSIEQFFGYHQECRNDYDDREGVAIDFVLETVNVTEDENGKIVFRHRRYIISGLHYA